MTHNQRFSLHDATGRNQKLTSAFPPVVFFCLLVFFVFFLSRCCLQVWTDEFLVWDPEEFDGIKEISLSSDSVWIPDVIVTEL